MLAKTHLIGVHIKGNSLAFTTMACGIDTVSH
jgi:hypothetical protein